ncbi:MAG: YifB family Mg chelatase-like AAA ATPase [Clostridia bacterium]
MLARIMSRGLNGIDGFSVTVEVDVSTGMPSYDLVGLPDLAVKESRERIRAALKNSGFKYYFDRVIVSLAPADTKKEGSIYDLPIAIGLLNASGQINDSAIFEYAIMGELALDGSVRAIRGVLPMVIGALESGIKKVIIPYENALEAAYIDGIEIYAVKSLRETVSVIRKEGKITQYPLQHWDPDFLAGDIDFSDIRGQQGAKRAAEVAVAGGHNMLMVGTPGSGKTMLAKRIPSILPELMFEEALEITKIQSIAGELRDSGGLVTERPFRSPHHTSSCVSLVGGGTKARPGEISLSHYGVLFLDELPEFKKDVLEALRQPLEDGTVTISRANARYTYPAEFILIAAMNPCPCGNSGSKVGVCRCSQPQINKYRQRISGPLLDRIDIHIEMTEVPYDDIAGKKRGESSAEIRLRVNKARALQRDRYKNEALFFNAQLNGKFLEKYCPLNESAESLLRTAYNRLNLSARAFSRIKKVARTIADLAGEEVISASHIAEAIQYRSLDARYTL